jgi:hypothetical protein
LAGFAEDGVTRLPSIDINASEVEFDKLSTLERKAACLSHFFLFRRAKVEEVGGLDETLGDAPGIDDYDFIWTLLEHGASVSIVPEKV